MKVLILLCLFSLTFFCKSVNAQIYIVTERTDVAFNPSKIQYDSVYVTSPTGVSTKYEIERLDHNIAIHDRQLNVILNGIISLGYKNMIVMSGQTSLSDKVIYFAKP